MYFTLAVKVPVTTISIPSAAFACMGTDNGTTSDEGGVVGGEWFSDLLNPIHLSAGFP